MNQLRGKTVPGVVVSEGMATFAHHVIRGETPAEAARLAGYSDPGTVGPLLIRHPLVRKALVDASEATLECDLLPLALRKSREILEDDNPKAVAVRAKLALGIIDRVAKNRQTAEDPATPLYRMSKDELERLVSKGLDAERQEANTVDVTPSRSVTP